MIEYEISLAIPEEERLVCKKCKRVISSCDKCGHPFQEREPIFCGDIDFTKGISHLCSNCYISMIIEKRVMIIDKDD
ncbi:MAG: hypothetical protein QXV17_09265 [Candidatus Micrarchaeaceae archaeon]